MELKNSIKKYRQLKGFTQEELAIKSGVSRQTIISIEKNKFFDFADFVLPTKTYAEHESTTINIEGRIKKSPKMVKNVNDKLLSCVQICESIFTNKIIDIIKISS